MKYVKLFEDYKREVNIDNNLLDSISKEIKREFGVVDINNTGSPLCVLFALRMREFIYKKTNKLHPFVIVFGIDGDYHKDISIPSDVNYILDNPDKFYLSHVVLNINDKLYDSDGFINKKPIKKNNEFIITDTNGDVAKKLLYWEDKHIDWSFEDKKIDKVLKLHETFSSDKEDIVKFLDDLPDDIILYRGLIIEKGSSINKNSLGTHWTLDEYFAKNLHEYETFFSKMEDEDLYVVTAKFKKSDIDYDGTIKKRFIKDNGFFWDELTGEMIENDDMDFHPYQHEDEILIKGDVTPVIISIDKIIK